jgi:hypothetical protein
MELEIGHNHFTLHFFYEFVHCLENKGWPPSRPDIFYPYDWQVLDMVYDAQAQALNFFSYKNQFQWIFDFSGAQVFDPQHNPRLDSVYTFGIFFGESGTIVTGSGYCDTFLPDQLVFPSSLEYIVFDIGYYVYDETTADIILTPILPPSPMGPG